jgi:hypothetical protein
VTDRDFWLTIRRALKMIVQAIDQRYTVQEETKTGRR